MILAPCAFAIFSSKDKMDPRTRSFTSGRTLQPTYLATPASWRATSASPSGDYDLPHTGDRSPARIASRNPPALALPSAAPRTRAASTLLTAAANAEAESIAAQVYAAQANKAALTAAARAASARAAAATALAADAERAVAEAARMAAAVRRAYETAPASVGPERHNLPETHPSMDFPRSHVIHRAA